MRLQCILDDCPANGEFVDHRKCCSCEHSVLGDEQPEFGLQECGHPNAVQDPNRQRWEDLKLLGPGILSVTLIGR